MQPRLGINAQPGLRGHLMELDLEAILAEFDRREAELEETLRYFASGDRRTYNVVCRAVARERRQIALRRRILAPYVQERKREENRDDGRGAGIGTPQDVV